MIKPNLDKEIVKGRVIKSGRPGSNRRHSAWKADALPTELLSHIVFNFHFIVGCFFCEYN